MKYEMEFKTALSITQEDAWQWVTSFNSINREVMPLLYLAPAKGFDELKYSDVYLGKVYCLLSLRLFGFLPVGRSRLAFDRFQLGAGFTEVSRMTGMKYWQHGRTLMMKGEDCQLVDTLTFEPVFLKSVVAKCVELLFLHRHKKLRQYIGQ